MSNNSTANVPRMTSIANQANREAILSKIHQIVAESSVIKRRIIEVEFTLSSLEMETELSGPDRLDKENLLEELTFLKCELVGSGQKHSDLVKLYTRTVEGRILATSTEQTPTLEDERGQVQARRVHPQLGGGSDLL